jgi:uncharacterized protein DUF4062
MKRFSRKDGCRKPRRPRPHDCNVTSSFHVSRDGILEDAPPVRYTSVANGSLKMQTKYQIFISSTYDDLKEERERVIKAILEMGHIPVGMEMFSAADESQWNIIKRRIEESDYYLVVVANRYGSTDDDGVSYTEREYDYAVGQGVPAIGFLLDDKAPWPTNRNDSDPVTKKRLEDFKNKLKKRLIKLWSTKDELAASIVLALTPLMTEQPRPGWVRGSEVPSAAALDELSRLSKENAELRDQLAKLDQERDVTRVIDSLRRRTISGTFTDQTPFESTLLSFFETIGRELTIEWATAEVTYMYVLALSDDKSRAIDPTFVEEWLKDLAVFDLIASRTEERGPFYSQFHMWWLTSFGKKVLAKIGSAEGNVSGPGGSGSIPPGC